MKKTAAWILVLTLALLLCACSSAKEDPNLGVYTGQSGAMGSLSVPVDAAFPGGFSLELKSDGRAALTVNGDEYNVKWSAEGDRLKVPPLFLQLRQLGLMYDLGKWMLESYSFEVE